MCDLFINCIIPVDILNVFNCSVILNLCTGFPFIFTVKGKWKLNLCNFLFMPTVIYYLVRIFKKVVLFFAAFGRDLCIMTRSGGGLFYNLVYMLFWERNLALSRYLTFSGFISAPIWK